MRFSAIKDLPIPYDKPIEIEVRHIGTKAGEAQAHRICKAEDCDKTRNRDNARAVPISKALRYVPECGAFRLCSAGEDFLKASPL